MGDPPPCLFINTTIQQFYPTPKQGIKFQQAGMAPAGGDGGGVTPTPIIF